MTEHLSSSGMTQTSNTRLVVPFVLLVLCLLALVVSLVGLYHTSALAETRVADLQSSWEATTQIEASGSRVAEIDRLMQGIARPVPEVQSAAWWSLAMGTLSLVFVVWFFWGVRSADKVKRLAYRQGESNEAVALARLLDEMAPLASGDLNVLASAREGTPGALADAFNCAIRELQRLARLQISASRSLADIVSQTQDFAASRVNSASERSELVQRSSNVLSGMSNVAGEVSVQASEVAAVNAGVIESAQDSTVSVQAFANTQLQVQADVRATLELLQGLPEQLELIDTSSHQIEDIRGRVDSLCTNAALALSGKEALDTRADSAGVVTQLSFELSALVEELNQANSTVSLAARSINSDISESVAMLTQVSQSCDEQLKQAGRVGSSIKRVEHSTDKLRAHAGAIAGQAAAQGHLVSALSKKLELINTGIDRDIDAARGNTDCVAELGNLANEMRQSLSEFNLPALNPSQVEEVVVDSSISPDERLAERALADD